MQTASEDWLSCELGSFPVEFGVCFIFVEILLDSSLCFALCRARFKAQEMAEDLLKSTNSQASPARQQLLGSWAGGSLHLSCV